MYTKQFQPFRPGRKPDLVERDPVKTKHDRGALLFQTWFNRLQADVERISDQHIAIMRSTAEMKRRLGALEETVRLHGQVIFEEESTVKFSCISCDHTFELSLPEARAANFTVICEKCSNWSLPFREDFYTLHQIANLTGFSYKTICLAARELGILFGQRDKKLDVQQFEKIKAILGGKTPRSRKPVEKEVEARR